VISRGLPAFLEHRAEREVPVPAFVVRAFRGYLTCGLLEHGFCRLKCATCGEEMVVAFSCKDRGFCPSCVGCRMNDTAAHLVDCVLPDVPARQWVLSLPPRLRMLCAFRPEAQSLVLRAYLRALFASYRRRARALGWRAGRCGAVTVIQRFDSACRLDVHFHSIVLDGVYVEDAAGQPLFRPLPAPTPAELAALVKAIVRRVERALRRRGFLGDQPLDDAVAEAPEVASLLRESVAYPSNRIVDPAKARPATDETTVGAAGGFNLHAGTVLGALDRDGRERLARYLLRPPLSDDRLTLRDDGKVELALKTPWRDGTVALVMTPEQLVARLAALVPRPGKNMVRYHGVLAPNASLRSDIVPGDETEPEDRDETDETKSEDRDETKSEDRDETADPLAQPEPGTKRRLHTGRYLLWAELMRRVFSADVLECPKCGGRLRLVAAIIDGLSARRYLEGVGLAEPRPGIAARGPPTERRVA
jgi:hypothetical protein